MAPEGLCSPAGPAIVLAINPTTASLDGAVLLVYLREPGPKRPHVGLSYIAGLGGQGASMRLDNWLPVRHAPVTLYLDEINSARVNALSFTTRGDRFVLGITFETTDPEVRGNCIRDAICPLIDPLAIDPAPPLRLGPRC